jgi:hypothetical protein
VIPSVQEAAAISNEFAFAARTAALLCGMARELRRVAPPKEKLTLETMGEKTEACAQSTGGGCHEGRP